MTTEEDTLAAVPELFDYVINCSIGDYVNEFVHSGNSMGYALFDCPDPSRYGEIVTRIGMVQRLKVFAGERG